MKFECISSGLNDSQYSLYDYSENPYGETVMSIEVHHQTKNWWFVEKPKNEMTFQHMKAFHSLLSNIISE